MLKMLAEICVTINRVQNTQTHSCTQNIPTTLRVRYASSTLADIYLKSLIITLRADDEDDGDEDDVQCSFGARSHRAPGIIH